MSRDSLHLKTIWLMMSCQRVNQGMNMWCEAMWVGAILKKERWDLEKLMIRSGGIDKPAAVYIAARDMRLEYHSSFIKSIRHPNRFKEYWDRPAMTRLQLHSKPCRQCVPHVSQQVKDQIGAYWKMGRLGERMPTWMNKYNQCKERSRSAPLKDMAALVHYIPNVHEVHLWPMLFSLSLSCRFP